MTSEKNVMRVRCPHCGHITESEVGVPAVNCERCGFPMNVYYVHPLNRLPQNRLLLFMLLPGLAVLWLIGWCMDWAGSNRQKFEMKT